MNLPKTCREIVKPVDLPAVDPTTDAGIAFMKDDAALLEAIDRLRVGASCLQDQDTKYAGKGKNR